MQYHLTALVTLLSLVLYWGLTALVGRARGQFGIAAPATVGHPEFERRFRVQQNTMESMAMHIPALWLFSIYLSVTWGALLGAAWIVGRILYARSYYADPKARGPGMLISIIATSALILGALGAVGMGLLKA